jgi:hypothetical protein
VIRASYILPLRSETAPSAEFIQYVNGLATRAEVLLIDGSPPPVYTAIHAQCIAAVRHCPPDEDLAALTNGKVRGVLTGLRLASHELVIVADDDVRYEARQIEQVLALLATAHVVRPQNYFDPLPWHARLDSARSLINRVTGGDWPGTLGVRRSILRGAGGYNGNVLFENLELVRTVVAAGGESRCPQDLFVRRLPPRTGHFWRQRVRQAYDEFARPWRLFAALTLLPLLAALTLAHQWLWTLAVFILAPVALAALGRRRDRGATVFPWTAPLWAPAWVLERALCVWAAVVARVVFGGVPYAGRIVTTAATPLRILRTQPWSAPCKDCGHREKSGKGQPLGVTADVTQRRPR